jgi:glutaminyl-tRNA synthetase
MGERELPFSRTLWIERDDFMEDPPKKFFRLRPGGEVRLRYAYIIRCDEVVKDDDGNVIELLCSYDPDTRSGAAGAQRKVKGTIHWLSAEHAVPAEVRLYDRLFTEPAPGAKGDWHEAINPDSLKTAGAWVEPGITGLAPGGAVQFERLGYFTADPDSSAESPVFNRIVTLRDSWAKVEKQAMQQAGAA